MRFFLLLLPLCLLFLLPQVSAQQQCAVGQEIVSLSQNSTVCANCSTGRYNINGNGVCRRCPDKGAKCNGGSSIVSQKDYWLYLDNKTGIVTPYSCPDNFCDENSICVDNRTGVLCGQCQQGFYQFFLVGGPCARCEKINWGLVFGMLLLLWVLVTIIIIAESFDNTAKMKIIVFYVQTLPLVLGPAFRTSQVLALFNLTGGSTTFLACLAPLDFYDQFLLNVLMPFVLFVFIPINYGIHRILMVSLRFCFTQQYFVKQWYPNELADGGWKNLKERIRKRFIEEVPITLYVRSSCALLLFNYSSVASAVFLLRTCRNVGDARVLASAPAVSCRDKTYKNWLIIATMLQVYVILFPIVLLCLLIYWYRKLKLFRTQYLCTVGVFYDAYKMRAFWWEPVTLARRTLIITLYLGLYNTAVWRTAALFLVTTAAFVFHILFYPYRQRVENFVEALFLLILMLVSGLQSSQAAQEDVRIRSWALWVILVVSFLGALILATWNFMLAGLKALAVSLENESLVDFLEWAESKLKEKDVNQPRSLSKFYSWQNKQEASENGEDIQFVHLTPPNRNAGPLQAMYAERAWRETVRMNANRMSHHPNRFARNNPSGRGNAGNSVSPHSRELNDMPPRDDRDGFAFRPSSPGRQTEGGVPHIVGKQINSPDPYPNRGGRDKYVMNL